LPKTSPLLGLARLVPHLGRHARAGRWKRSGKRPRVWAHRGASAHAPENTMAAFFKAVEAGADGVELDVRFDGDKNVVVFHDNKLERLTGNAGMMDALSASSRAALRVKGEPVPLLADVLHEIDLEIDVEIKSNSPGREGELVAAVARVIKDSGRIDDVCVSSFDPVILVQFHRHLPEVACGYIFGDDQILPARKGWVGNVIGAALCHPQHTLVTEATITAWHRQGMPVNTWTVDDPAELRRLDELGVDGVFANDPAAALAVFATLDA
jgi:glycerophosphoryl diester phosphodiesterase